METMEVEVHKIIFGSNDKRVVAMYLQLPTVPFFFFFFIWQGCFGLCCRLHQFAVTYLGLQGAGILFLYVESSGEAELVLVGNEAYCLKYGPWRWWWITFGRKSTLCETAFWDEDSWYYIFVYYWIDHDMIDPYKHPINPGILNGVLIYIYSGQGREFLGTTAS